MREALIKVFHDDAGFEQGQLTIDQRWHGAIGVEVNKILRQVIHLNLLNLDTDTFFGQYDTYLMAKNVGRAGKQRHYRTFVGSDSHENLQVI